MKTQRIHITGASGSGTTTLGRALAGARGLPCFDTDDFLWRPSNPPHRIPRPVAERLQLMSDLFRPFPGWALSGSVMGWSDALKGELDLVVFLYVSAETRLHRLLARETARFGNEAVAPGGWRASETQHFLEWAAHYEDGDREGRPLGKHSTWLETLRCPTLRLDGKQRTDDLATEIAAALR